MPEMDGLEACAAIVNNPTTAHIPVVMTTSNDTPEFRKRGIASGASGFLSKGLEDRELDNVLDGVSGSKIDQKAGGVMTTGSTELSEETLSLIRDQAINAARKASEEYFTGQLPGLEEQVVKVAENTARRFAGSGSGGGDIAGGDLLKIRDRLDNLQHDPQVKAMVAKMISEESAIFKGTASHAQAAYNEPTGGSFFGKLIKTIFFLLVIAGAGYWALTMFMPDHPITAMVSGLVTPLLDSIMNK